MKVLSTILLSILLLGDSSTYEKMLGSSQIKDYNKEKAKELPVCDTDGGVVFYANGGVKTNKESIFGKFGFDFDIVNGSDFNSQVKAYLDGRPWLYGTVRMIGSASEVLNKDPRTKPIMVLMTSHDLGQHIVVPPSVKTITDLKGKSIAVKLPISSQLGLIADTLKTAKLKISDVTLVPYSDKDSILKVKADVFCVNTIDMKTLCYGLFSAGNGKNGTTAGARVINSTNNMSKSITNGYWVRKDYYDDHKAEIEKFVAAWFKARKDFLWGRTCFSDTNPEMNTVPESLLYAKSLKTMEKFYGKNENVIQDLISDIQFSGIPENEFFFESTPNFVGFKSKMESALDFALEMNFISKKIEWDKSIWDYKKISQLADINYVPPKFKQGRVNHKAINFANTKSFTIISFTINFDVGKNTFDPSLYINEFEEIAKALALFDNSVLLVKGHSDTIFVLKNFFLAARSDGLITGNAPHYRLDRRALDLTDTGTIIKSIGEHNLAGQRDNKGELIDDPAQTLNSANNLSQLRAENAKKILLNWLKEKIEIDRSRIQAKGLGISEPIFPMPLNKNEMSENRRVEFVLIRANKNIINPHSSQFEYHEQENRQSN